MYDNIKFASNLYETRNQLTDEDPMLSPYIYVQPQMTTLPLLPNYRLYQWGSLNQKSL